MLINKTWAEPHPCSNHLTPCSCSFCFFFSSLRSLTLRNLALPMPPALRIDSSRLARPSDGWTTSLGAPDTGPVFRGASEVWVYITEVNLIYEDKHHLVRVCVCITEGTGFKTLSGSLQVSSVEPVRDY